MLKPPSLFILLCLTPGFISNCRNADHPTSCHPARANILQPIGGKNPLEQRISPSTPTDQPKNPVDSELKVTPLGGIFAVEIRRLTPPGQIEWERDPKAIAEEIVEDMKKSLPPVSSPERD